MVEFLQKNDLRVVMILFLNLKDSASRRHIHRHWNPFHQGDQLNLNLRNALRHQGVQKNNPIMGSQLTVGIPFECLKMQRRHQTPVSEFTDNGRNQRKSRLSSLLLKHYVTHSYCRNIVISKITQKPMSDE